MITKRSLQNLSALMMLLAVDKYQSKRKVAECINTSIDTVNKYLRNLEQNFGQQLIVNSTNGCRLTLRAKNIVERLQNVYEVLDQISNQRQEDGTCKGDVSVCLPLSASTNLLPYDIDSFFDQYPEIKITSLTTAETLNYEEVGADLAVVFGFDENSQRYSLVHQKTIEIGLYASPKYLNKHGYPKDMDDLLKNHRIASQIGSYRYIPGWQDILTKAEHCTFASNSNYSVCEAIKHGFGIGVMPLKDDVSDLVSLDNFKFDSKQTLYLIVNNNTRNIPRVRAVTEYYRSLMNSI